ncbi:uncharacterized protein [Rutidosis leptorrhynchoides]|uniref:uncharacterized protein n=1 Tax=Rutidosis leptorrhynchoides TaxID=125765 RepID=UPI003A994428
MFKWVWKATVNNNELWFSVIKSVHGDLAGLDGSKFKGKRFWVKIVDTFQKAKASGLVPANILRKKVGNGRSIRFWKDNCLGGGSLKDKFPRLYHLEVNPDCLVSDRVVNGTWCWNWRRSDLGSRVTGLIVQMEASIDLPLISYKEDQWEWIIADDSLFSVGVTRKFLDNILLPSLGQSTKWVNTLPRKVNIFIWRLAKNRLPTRLNL